MALRDRIVDLRRVPASDLIPHPDNWRTHPARQRAILADMLAEVGVADAVIAYERPDGALQLIDGHLRADVAGDETVPVLVLDVDEEEARKLLLSLDPLAAMAETSRARLQDLLAGVQAKTEGLDELMATLGSPRAFDQLQDEPPAPPRKAKTKPGDMWLLGESRIACLDSTDATAVAATLEGVGPARAIVTDPPYGVSYKNERGEGIANDELRGAALQQLISGALKALEPATTKGTTLYIFHGDWERIATQLGCEEAGYGIHATLVWVKNKATLTHADYRFQHEPILYGWRRGGRRKWYGGRRPTTLFADDLERLRLEASHEQLLEVIEELMGETSVIREPMPVASPDHPTTKPVPLLARLIANSTQHGDLVLDPFAGSGSTIVAATGLGRRAVGLELEPRFVDVVCARWQRTSGQLPVLASSGEATSFVT